MHKHLMYFNPDVMSLEQSHQDFSSKMGCFNAGEGYENFNDFITSEADEYKQAGDGVTYVVWNVLYDKNNVETEREIVAYYTLAATAIPIAPNTNNKTCINHSFPVALFPPFVPSLVLDLP